MRRGRPPQQPQALVVTLSWSASELNKNHRWLWVRLKAGTTLRSQRFNKLTVVPASAGPITQRLLLRGAVAPACPTRIIALWVPAQGRDDAGGLSASTHAPSSCERRDHNHSVVVTLSWSASELNKNVVVMGPGSRPDDAGGLSASTHTPSSLRTQGPITTGVCRYAELERKRA